MEKNKFKGSIIISQQQQKKEYHKQNQRQNQQKKLENFGKDILIHFIFL